MRDATDVFLVDAPRLPGPSRLQLWDSGLVVLPRQLLSTTSIAYTTTHTGSCITSTNNHNTTSHDNDRGTAASDAATDATNESSNGHGNDANDADQEGLQ